MNALLDIGIISGPAVIAVLVVTGIVAALFVLIRPGVRWKRGTWIVTAVGAALAGSLIGATLTWVIADQMDAFGVDLTFASRVWIALGFAGTAVALVSLWRASWKRIVAVPLAIVLFLATSAMGVNIAFGQYPTIRSALGLSAFAGDVLPNLSDGSGTRPTVADWTAPAGMPTQGSMASVVIPATESGFVARDATVYLPPAALTDNPPLLPVLVMMSGQPGATDEVFTVGHLRDTLDAYAAAHQGLAPIVVSPDQLGSPDANPMCVDSPLGNSATYITVDVPNWINANLAVLPSPEYWGVGGLSQGGTCSIQLGAQHPELFSAILDASGEEFPTLGDATTTIDEGFGGDAAKYAAAYPAAIMASKAPYTDMFAVFGVGSADTAFLPGVQKLYNDAQAAGMDATYLESAGNAHDSAAWSYVFTVGLGLIADHWGLNR